MAGRAGDLSPTAFVGIVTRPGRSREGGRPSRRRNVLGTVLVPVLYRAPDGRTEQKRVMLPPDAAWELLFNARKGDSLEVTAQSAEPGSVTCEIIVDGRRIAERSESQNVPVTCRGVVTAP